MKNASQLKMVMVTAILTMLPAFANASDEKKPLSQLIISVLILAFVVGFFLLEHKTKEQNASLNRQNALRAADARQKMLELISSHLPALRIKYRQSVFLDAYGILDTTQWTKEIDYFIDKVLPSDAIVSSYLFGLDFGDPLITMDAVTSEIEKLKLRKAQGIHVAQAKFDGLKSLLDSIKVKSRDRRIDAQNVIRDRVWEFMSRESGTQESSLGDLSNLDPIQFEHFCVGLLNSSGWTARVTQASGDQGIDIIALHGKVKAVFQCKKYSQPVGNAAVQEIIAGKAFEQAHVGALISNATFTASAKQLAFSTGIYLLHHSELPQFAANLGLVDSERLIV